MFINEKKTKTDWQLFIKEIKSWIIRKLQCRCTLMPRHWRSDFIFIFIYFFLFNLIFLFFYFIYFILFYLFYLFIFILFIFLFIFIYFLFLFYFYLCTNFIVHKNLQPISLKEWASQLAPQSRIHLPMQETQEIRVWSLSWDNPLE